MLPAKHKKLIPNSSQSGQGILEVIVTIGIGTIMILALVVLSVRTNRSSDFSKASSQASSLAAEGIEIINNLKEMNGTDPNLPGTNKLFRLDSFGSCSGSGATDKSWDELFDVNVQDQTCAAGTFGRVGYIINNCSTDKNCISFKDSDETSYANTSVDTRVYKREVFIADTPKDYPLGSVACASSPNSCGRSNCDLTTSDYTSIKQFTVVVSWTDSSGTHNQTQTACYQK